LANVEASLPVAYRLYLPEVWAADMARRKKAGVPEEIGFQTKIEIALDQIRAAHAAGLPQGPVLMDAGYGPHSDLRTAVTALGCLMSPVFCRTPRYGRPALGLCRPRPRRRVDRPSACAAMPSIGRAISKILRSAFRPEHGERSRGGREPTERSDRALR